LIITTHIEKQCTRALRGINTVSQGWDKTLCRDGHFRILNP